MVIKNTYGYKWYRLLIAVTSQSLFHYIILRKYFFLHLLDEPYLVSLGVFGIIGSTIISSAYVEMQGHIRFMPVKI